VGQSHGERLLPRARKRPTGGLRQDRPVA
jgi:hypothetical protein